MTVGWKTARDYLGLEGKLLSQYHVMLWSRAPHFHLAFTTFVTHLTPSYCDINCFDMLTLMLQKSQLTARCCRYRCTISEIVSSPTNHCQRHRIAAIGTLILFRCQGTASFVGWEQSGLLTMEKINSA